MAQLPQSIQQAIRFLTRLPGVGEKSALRHLLTITKWKPEDIEHFAQSLNDLNDLKHCSQCQVFSEDDVCQTCLNEERRETKLICVVETISDYLAIERSGHYKGLYYILGGVLNPLLGVGPQDLGIDRLTKRIQEEGIKEVILAINPSVEGDATCAYIKEVLPSEMDVERIGFGVPMGGSLEYLDSLTISKAFENKRRLE